MTVKRRGHGEGSIYRRGDRWEATIDLGRGPNGRRRRKTLSAATRREAQENLRRLQAEKAAGMLPTNKDGASFATLLDEWLRLTIAPNSRPNTVATYTLLVEKHIKPALGKAKLRDVTPHAIQTFLEGRSADAGLSARTVALIRGVISDALAQAVTWGWIVRNPAEQTKAPKGKATRKPPTISAEDAAKLAAALRSDRRGRPALVALATGLRFGEVLGLRWSEVDFDAAELRVSRQVEKGAPDAEGKRHWELDDVLKSDASARRLALPPFLLEELLLQRAEQQIKEEEGDLDLVFTNRMGGPLAQDTVRDQLYRIWERAGLPKYRFHDLRHIFVTLLMNRGTHTRILSELVGHASHSTTTEIYGHVLLGADQDAARLIERLLDPPKREGEG